MVFYFYLHFFICFSPNTNGLPLPVKTEPKISSPASSHGSPPNGLKKTAHSHSAHSSKPKAKDTPSHSMSYQGTKRSSVSDDLCTKTKKKKTDKTENTLLNPAQKVIKEISILSPATSDVDPAKPKGAPTGKKVKEIRERRKSTEISTLASTESPRSTPKEGKHRGKEIKLKKEKEKKSDKKNSPDLTLIKDEHPKLQKFTIKRTADDAWSSVNASPNSNNNNNNNNTTAVVGTILSNTATTMTIQNERVNALFAEFAEEDSSSDGDMCIALPHDDLRTSVKQQTPVNMLSPEITNNSKPKKSKIHKSSSIVNGKLNDSKTEVGKKLV